MDGELLAGRYLLGETLGSGGVAHVRRAWDTRLDRPVAVKTLRGDPDRVDLLRFGNEVHALAMLEHPGLVEVYDAGHDNGRPYVVLRLVEGPTLRDRIANGPLSVPETRRLGERLAAALAHVHEHGVTHRDVKPSNILLDPDGTPLLADFGASRLSGSDQLTGTNEMIGTAAYLAPEQVRGDEVAGPADVYALGLVLLECLTGHAEYPGSNVESAVARLHRPPAIPPDLPPDLARLLTLMTSLSAHRRPTAAECATALAGAAPTPTEVLPWMEAAPPPPRPRRAIAAGLVAAVGVAAWAIAGAGQSTPPPPAAVISPPAVSPSTTPDEPDSPVTPVAAKPVAKNTGSAVIASGKDRDDKGKPGARKADRGKGKSKK